MSVAVVGAGAVGAATAVELQRLGLHVSVFDAAHTPDERASWGNATMIANELSAPLSSWATARKAPGRLFAFGGPLDFVLRDAGLWAPWALRYLLACSSARFGAGCAALDRLCLDAVPAWRRLLARAGRLELLDETPHWALWESAASFAAGAADAQANHSSAVQVRNLASQEVQALKREVCPALAGGVAFEGGARLKDPGEAVEALHAAVIGAGGRVVQAEVRTLQVQPDRVTLEIAGEHLSFDHAVIACGARSAPLVKPAGLSAPLVAERGYHLQYADHDLAPDLPALVLEERFICVVRAGDHVRVTGFTEIGRPGSPPDPRKWAALERHVAQLGLPVRGAPQRWMGARPTLPDFLPAIGRKGPLLYAFGHQHIGLTLAAVTAEAVGRLVLDGGQADLEPFALERFGRREH
ncbi:MAG: FAD-binding oxidoreductase [Acetobacteraceae bacterium]|nr:FAD-binding oxidoreductase [Acetobacteraceae bacterium]